MNGIGVVWVFALMFLICADIIGRTLFDSPLQAVPEIVAFSLIACVFLQLAFATKMNRLTPPVLPPQPAHPHSERASPELLVLAYLPMPTKMA